MAEKLSDKLKAAFRKVDTGLGKGVDKATSFKMPTLSSLLSKNRGAPKGAVYPKASEFKAFQKGQKTKALLSSKKLPSASKALVTAKTAKNFRKLGTLGRLARATTPIGLGLLAAEAVYKTATPSKEAKAKIEATKKRLSKTTTKQMHEDLIKAKGGKMLKGDQKKLDKNKDGKISGEDFKMMKAKKGKDVNIDLIEKIVNIPLIGKGRLKTKVNKKSIGGKMMYANMGMEAKSTQGYGAARKSGMGLQDEQLPAGKTLDYYKDIM